jgi:hypothetical protein
VRGPRTLRIPGPDLLPLRLHAVLWGERPVEPLPRSIAVEPGPSSKTSEGMLEALEASVPGVTRAAASPAPRLLGT